jgi:hypothetical protein
MITVLMITVLAKTPDLVAHWGEKNSILERKTAADTAEQFRAGCTLFVTVPSAQAILRGGAKFPTGGDRSVNHKQSESRNAASAREAKPD